MSGAGLRQATLAENLANANTPGYLRRDVDFHAELRDALDRGGDVGDTGFAVRAQAGGAMRADGNGVDIDVESAQLAQNALDYEAMVSVAGARTDIMRIAMGIR
ncbi:MAG: flagellar basal body protein [Actinobacteria bacterium]|nr:flagellar basal body protein [Actinomycetota bacterium]